MSDIKLLTMPPSIKIKTNLTTDKMFDISNFNLILSNNNIFYFQFPVASGIQL